MIKEFESIAKKIQADFERTKNLPHQGVKGATREQIVAINFLNEYLPKKYSIGSGLITDAEGKFSKQQDLVIYDGFNFPILQNFDQSKVFFAEQVYAAIEVKSGLPYGEITDVMDKAASIGTLSRANVYQKYSTSEITETINGSPIFVFGFAYESQLLLNKIRDYIQKKVRKSASHWNISALVVLSDGEGKSGVITNLDPNEINMLKIMPSSDSPLATVRTRTQGEALFTFYLQLMQALKIAEITSFAPNYLAYAKTAGLGTIDVEVGKIGLEGTAMFNAVEIIRHAHLRSNKEVLDAYYYLNSLSEQTGIANAHYLNDAIFTIGDMPIGEPKPKDIWDSLNNYKKNVTTAIDNQRLEVFLNILRKVSLENTYISIVTLAKNT